MEIDESTELVKGEKLNEPFAKIIGRLNHQTMEFELLINYDVFSEKMAGKFVFYDYTELDGVVYNEAAGFTKEEGNYFKLREI